jgi:hypothetical protein
LNPLDPQAPTNNFKKTGEKSLYRKALSPLSKHQSFEYDVNPAVQKNF